MNIMSNQPNRAIRRSQSYQDYVNSLPQEAKEVPMEIRNLIYTSCRSNRPLLVIDKFQKIVIANYSAQQKIENQQKALNDIIGHLFWAVIHQGNDYY